MKLTTPILEQTTTILQIQPAQPGTVAVSAKVGRDDEPLYSTEPVFCWALVEKRTVYQNRYEETIRYVAALVNKDPDSDEDPDAHLTILEGVPPFLGYSFPGDSTDWQSIAIARRDEL